METGRWRSLRVVCLAMVLGISGIPGLSNTGREEAVPQEGAAWFNQRELGKARTFFESEWAARRQEEQAAF